MAATSVRVLPAVALSVAIAAVTSWALRDNAQYLPRGDVRPNPLAGVGHGHAGDGYTPPPPVTGEPLASHVGLGVFALHALLITVVAASCALRRLRRSGVDNPGPVARLGYATAIAAGSGLVAAGMAGLLLGGAISFAAALTAATTVLRLSFVLAVAFSAVFGIP